MLEDITDCELVHPHQVTPELGIHRILVRLALGHVFEVIEIHLNVA